jgi:hypothetical protein
MAATLFLVQLHLLAEEQEAIQLMQVKLVVLVVVVVTQVVLVVLELWVKEIMEVHH